MGHKFQKMHGNSLKARQPNSLPEDVRTTLKNHDHDIEVHEAYVTAEKVRNAFLGITSRQQTLLELFWSSGTNRRVKSASSRV